MNHSYSSCTNLKKEIYTAHKNRRLIPTEVQLTNTLVFGGANEPTKNPPVPLLSWSSVYWNRKISYDPFQNLSLFLAWSIVYTLEIQSPICWVDWLIILCLWSWRTILACSMAQHKLGWSVWTLDPLFFLMNPGPPNPSCVSSVAYKSQLFNHKSEALKLGSLLKSKLQKNEFISVKWLELKRVEKTVKAVVQGLTIEVQMNLIDSSMSKLMFQGSKLIWLYRKTSRPWSWTQQIKHKVNRWIYCIIFDVDFLRSSSSSSTWNSSQD